MGNTTPNVEKTLRFTEVNFPEVHRYKRKSQTKKLQSWLQSLCSKLGLEGYTDRTHGSGGRSAGEACVQSTKK